MPYLLVPGEVSAAEANIWVGALNERPAASQIALESSAGPIPLDPNWIHWASRTGQQTLDSQVVQLSGLQPRTTHTVQLRVDGQIQASASVTTLPDRLPTPDAKPFTILLGSCFASAEDSGGNAGQTFLRLPGAARPDVKVLCGDQVYLDSPWHHYLLHTHKRAELEAEFFANYQATWTQAGPGQGFRGLLQEGANYFSSDDHEYWNNAPTKGTYVRDTWTDGGRDRWLEIARDLYRRFQSGSDVKKFSVPPLYFFNAETRFNRLTDKTVFMLPGDLDQLRQWIGKLAGPGLVVVGQPVLSGKAGFMGHFADWALPDFTQYGELVRALASSKHSIVILTGDVHYGRVANCTLPTGVELIEVISSPLALVDSHAKGKWAKAPEVFPAVNVAGVPKVKVETQAFTASDDHFLTLEFSASGARAKMAVRAWSIVGAHESWAGQTVYERLLS